MKRYVSVALFLIGGFCLSFPPHLDAQEATSTLQPMHLDASKVAVAEASTLALLGYALTIWPSHVSFVDLQAHIQALEHCLIFQSEPEESLTRGQTAGNRPDSEHWQELRQGHRQKGRQISCVSATAILSAYASEYGVYWSEARIDMQPEYSAKKTSSFWKNRAEETQPSKRISQYISGGQQVTIWLSDQNMDDLQQRTLQAARGRNWRITLHDHYAGSFVIGKENQQKRVSIAGWLQDDGRVFVTEVTQKKP